jgi:dihydrofolate reductase
MSRLVYSGIMSLDGYTVDAGGSFDWSTPDEEVHTAVNDLERGIGTHLLGRRMYDVLAVWETMMTAGEPAVIAEYARIWRGSEKIVYSRTLTEVRSAKTVIAREFDPAEVERLKRTSEADLSVGGATLAAEAIRAGLVDDYHLFISPVVVGGGTPYLPKGVRLALSLVSERRFDHGVVHLHYRAS